MELDVKGTPPQQVPHLASASPPAGFHPAAAATMRASTQTRINQVRMLPSLRVSNRRAGGRRLAKPSARQSPRSRQRCSVLPPTSPKHLCCHE